MTLTINLPAEDLLTLDAQAKARGVSLEECAGEILKRALAPQTPKPILAARIREIWSDLPDDVKNKLPTDGASQHDHYIYGVPKRET